MIQYKPISSQRDIEEASELMTSIFTKDPFMVKLFDGKNMLKHLKRFFDYIIYANVAREEITLGIIQDSSLIGLFLVETTSGLHKKQLLRKVGFMFKTLKFYLLIPKKALKVFNKSIEINRNVRPKEPHHYLHYMGIRTDLQGKGIGREIMEYILKLVDEDSRSIGIGLDTENYKNVSLCLKLGYEIVAQVTIDDMPVYCLFRQKDRKKQQ